MGEHSGMNDAVDFYLKGFSRYEISELLGVNYSTLCRVLRRHGITKRREVHVRECVRAKSLGLGAPRYAGDLHVARVATDALDGGPREVV